LENRFLFDDIGRADKPIPYWLQITIGPAAQSKQPSPRRSVAFFTAKTPSSTKLKVVALVEAPRGEGQLPDIREI
jgi:hypothetical protein